MLHHIQEMVLLYSCRPLFAMSDASRLNMMVAPGAMPPVRAGASYFRLVRPLRALLSVNKVGESAGMLSLEKFGTLRSVLRPCLGHNAARISPPVVSVAREATESSCQ